MKIEKKRKIPEATRSAGRPSIDITPDLIERARELASHGLTQREIAPCLGMGESTLYEKIRAYPEFLEAIEQGKAKGIATIANAVFNKAEGGDMTAATFYLKNRAPDLFGDKKTIDFNMIKTPNLTEKEKLLADKIIDEITNGNA